MRRGSGGGGTWEERGKKEARTEETEDELGEHGEDLPHGRQNHGQKVDGRHHDPSHHFRVTHPQALGDQLAEDQGHDREADGGVSHAPGP